MTELKVKMYIVNLDYDSWHKRLYLEGEDSEKGQTNFNRIVYEELKDIKHVSKDWPEYIRNAISHFAQYGFSQIRK